MTVSEDFTGLTSRFRGELLAHCYRIAGVAVDERRRRLEFQESVPAGVAVR